MYIYINIIGYIYKYYEIMNSQFLSQSRMTSLMFHSEIYLYIYISIVYTCIKLGNEEYLNQRPPKLFSNLKISGYVIF